MATQVQPYENCTMLLTPMETFPKPRTSATTVFMDCQDASSGTRIQLYSTKQKIISFLLAGISNDRIVQDCKPLCGGRIVRALPGGDF